MPAMRSLPAILSLSPCRLLLGVASVVVGVLAGTGVTNAQAMGTPIGHQADSQVLPIWNTRSGRVEALLLLSPEQKPNSPLERLLSPTPALAGLGLGITMDDGSRLQASLTPETNTGLALLCSQGIHVAMALGGLGEQCLLAEVGTDDDLVRLANRNAGGRLDARWQSAGGGLDLSFGLSWLEGSLQTTGPQSFAGPDTNPIAFPTLPRPLPLGLGELSSRQLHMQGSLALAEQRWLSLGGSIGSQQLDSLLGAPLRWDNATVTLGVGFRGLSGRLTGHLIELPAGQGSFTGLDLGFSWRTPWQGELSFGAKNLLNQTPDTTKWPLPELPALETPGGRTPYVRYKQDL